MDRAARNSLDQQLLAAHRDDDRPTLVTLYTRAGDSHENTGNIDAACFYLTHAYVFALQQGMVEADKLRQRLIAYGREE